MSAGHIHADETYLNSQALDRALRDPAVQELRWRYIPEDDQHDIPFLGGYSGDGKKIYLDRHLPRELKITLDGKTKIINPRDYVRVHEEWEWIFMEALGWNYLRAHPAATAMERRSVLERLGPGWWTSYCDVLRPYIKADEHERIEKVPRDLDMRAYAAPPVSRSLIAHMQRKMGRERKFSQDEVNYRDDRGGPNRRCGPVQAWPKSGVCGHYEAPHQCLIVKGYIEQRGGCDKWESISHELREHGIKQIGELAREPTKSSELREHGLAAPSRR